MNRSLVSNVTDVKRGKIFISRKTGYPRCNYGSPVTFMGSIWRPGDRLWTALHVTNIIGMSIHKELSIAICTMHYVAISIRVCEISLWRPLRHATGGSKSWRSGLSDRQPSVSPVSPGLSRRRPMCHRVEVETDILNHLCMLKLAIIAQVVSCNQGWGQVLFEVLESSTSTFSYLQV